MPKTAEIVIGNSGADHVSFRAGGRDDEGWSSVEIGVSCDGWSGSMKGSFFRGELARFGEQLHQLHRDLSGIARLHPLEPNIALTLIGDGKGHILVKGEAQNHFEGSTRLTFEFTIDQTYLKGIADALSQADPE